MNEADLAVAANEMIAVGQELVEEPASVDQQALVSDGDFGLGYPPPTACLVDLGGEGSEELRCAARRQALARYRLDALGFRPITSVAAGPGDDR